MKIGVYLGDFTPTSGGGFTFSEEVLGALAALGNRHIFYVFGFQMRIERHQIRNNSLHVVSLDGRFAKRPSCKLLGAVANAMRKTKFPIRVSFFVYRVWLKRMIEDIGIEFMWFPNPHYIEVDVPYVFTVWDLQHRLQPWFPEVSARREWRKRERKYARALRRASIVVVGTEAGREEVERFYQIPPDRVKLIPHPTPGFALNVSKDSSGEVMKKYKLKDGYLFYPAQFWPHKNHVGLLMAVKILRDKHGVSLPLVLVGSNQGNLKNVLNFVERVGLTEQVHYLGLVPQDDLVGLYRNALALIYPSYFGPENFPPLEAFALGCPVIASNVPGSEEQLGDAALLIDPGNPEAIALAIKRLHEDGALRQELIGRGLVRARSRTGESFVKSNLSAIEEFEGIVSCWRDGFENVRETNQK